MMVQELLDKQYELPSIILINEDYDRGRCVCASRMHLYLKNSQQLDEICDEYGRREVAWFNFFLSIDNKIVMFIQLVKEA